MAERAGRPVVGWVIGVSTLIVVLGLGLMVAFVLSLFEGETSNPTPVGAWVGLGAGMLLGAAVGLRAAWRVGTGRTRRTLGGTRDGGRL